jgi:hypothetical protein
MEELFVYSGSSLNYLTKYSGQEHMCGIYMLDQGDGNSEYIMSSVFTGEPNNVIIPYIASTFAAEGYTNKLSNMYHGAQVQYLGILHSHPSRESHDGKYDNNQEFSWGDAVAAAISGKIWLTTQDGSMYALDRERAMPIIWPGLIRDAAVRYSNDLHAKGVKWEDYPQWLKDYWPNIRKH